MLVQLLDEAVRQRDKQEVSKVVVMKLAHQVSLQIKQAKKQNLARAASLANYLVLLKLPEKMTAQFIKFAVHVNVKIGNLDSASKLGHPIRGVNQTEYPDKCPQCFEALPFGLAQP